MATRLPRHLRVLVEVLLVEIVMEALMAQFLVFEIDVLRIVQGVIEVLGDFFLSACPLEEGDRIAETGLDRT